MNDNQMISIVMPLYNAEMHLHRTLDSIVAQNSNCYECIVVDDGSTDNSFQIANNFAKKNKNFHILKRNHNLPKGANTCRNIGIKYSNSELLMFMDSDDLISPSCLSSRLDVIKENPLNDMWIFSTAFMDNENNIVGNFFCGTHKRHELISLLVQHKIPWHTMSPIWTKKFINKIGCWNEDYERLQDVELNIRALGNYPKLFFGPSVVDSYYRTNEMTPIKKKAARYGFCKLIRDYYIPLTTDEHIELSTRQTIDYAFEENIEALFLQYLVDEKDEKWSKLFLTTLKKIGVDDEELISMNDIMKKFNG